MAPLLNTHLLMFQSLDESASRQAFLIYFATFLHDLSTLFGVFERRTNRPNLPDRRLASTQKRGGGLRLKCAELPP